MKLISHSLTPVEQIIGIRSLHGGGTLVRARTQTVLYLQYSTTRLALKLFRGERAISEFDWPFTPIHSSSPRFSTQVGSDLHNLLQLFHPDHG